MISRLEGLPVFIRPTYGGEHGYGVFHRPDPEKETIMRFFNASCYEVAAAGCFEDEVTGEYTRIPEVTTMRDGVVWGNKDAYHFEKYDMELSPEFCAYAITHAPKA